MENRHYVANSFSSAVCACVDGSRTKLDLCHDHLLSFLKHVPLFLQYTLHFC